MKSFLRSLVAVTLVFALSNVNAQQSVSIGTTNLDRDAVLFLLGDGTQGLIIPKTTDLAGMPKKAGMVVYNETDGQVYSCDGTLWTALGGGSAGADPVLQINGNNLSIFNGQNVPLALANPTSRGQILMWNGTGWTVNASIAPVTNDVLIYNGNQWVPSSNYITTINGTAPVSVVTTNNTAQVTVSNITNNEISNSAGITDSKLATISTAGKVSGSAINSGTITGSTAINTTGNITTTGTLGVTGTTTLSSLSGVGNRMVVADAAGVITTAPLPINATLTNLTSPNAAINITNGTNAVIGLTPVTINIANATTSQAGLLTAADFTTFSNKQNTINLTTTGTSGAATLVGGTLNIPQYAGTGDITDVIAGTGLTGGATTGSATLNVNVGTAANQIVQLDASSRLPAVDGSQLTNLSGDISAVVAGTGLTGGATTGSATLNVNTGTGANQIPQLDGAGKLLVGTIPTGTAANQIVQLDGTGRLPAVDGSQLTNLSGDISAVVAGTGLTGGATTGSATLNVNAGTGANQIVQLDASSRLPAVDGSQLTNLAGDISAVVAGTGLTGGAATGSATLNVNTGTGANQIPQLDGAGKLLVGTIPTGTAANQIVQLDGTGRLPAVDGSQLTNLSGDISAVVAGTGLTGGATTGSATLNVNAGTGANQIVQLDASSRLPAVDGSQLTNLSGDISSVVAGTGLTGGATTGAATLNVNVGTGANQIPQLDGTGKLLVGTIPTGTAANQIVQLDGTGRLPAVDGSQLTGLAGGGDITGVTAGTGLTGGATSGDATLNVNVGTGANQIVQLDASSRLPAVDGSQLTNLAGDISAVVAGTGLTGGATTGSATLNVNTGIGPNQIVQLDASSRLPAVDGSQLTNLSGDISAVVAGTGLTGGAATGSATLNVNVGTAANQIVQLDGTGRLPAVDGSQLTGLAGGGDITGVTAGTGLTGGAASGDATLNVNVGTGANQIVQLDASSRLPAVDGSQLTNLPGGGDITAVVAGTGLTGGAATGSATLNVNTGTGPSQIVQLDASSRLPAVDGSQLTNLSGDISAVVAGTGLTGGATTGSATLNVNTGTGANQIPQLDGAGKLLVGTIPTGTAANQIVQLDGTGRLPAVDGSQLTNLSGDISAVVAGIGLTGGAATGSATLNVNVGTGANQIVQLDASSRLPAVDGSQLTNLPGGGDITAVVAGTGLTGGAATGSATLNVNVGTGANQIPQLDGAGKLLVGTIPTGTAANQIVQLDGTGRLPAVDGSQLTGLAGGGDITGVTAGTGLTGGAASGDATLNVNVGTGANQIVQLDASSRLPAVDGSQLTNLAGDISGVVAGTGLTGGATSGSATLNVNIGTGANQIPQLDGTGKLNPVVLPASVMTNPLTTNGDIIYGVGSTPTRLAAGTGFLRGGATPSYSAVGLATSDVTGTLPITSGGTGATTPSAALTALGGFSNPMTTAGDIIYRDGTGPQRLATGTGFLRGGATPSYSAVGLATTDVTGTLPITSGGTGATTPSAALTALGGFSNPMTTAGDIIYRDGTGPQRLATGTGFLRGGATPSYSAIGLATTDVTGTLPVARGGTGVTTAANGQLLIGNGAGFTAATLTAGTNTSITNGAGTITINSTGLGTTLTNGQIFVGNLSNVATGVAMNGDASISNTGLVTLANSSGTRTNLGLGSISTQNANTVAITGGTITGLTTPLDIGSGGTGTNSVTLGGVAYGAIGAINYTAQGTAGQLLQSNGTGAPTWVNAPATITASNGLTRTANDITLGGNMTGTTTTFQGTADNMFEIQSSGAALGTKAGIHFKMFQSAINTQYEIFTRKMDAVANSGNSDLVMTKVFSTAGGYLDAFTIQNSTNNIIINNNKTTASAYGNFIVANGNVGIKSTSPTSTLEVRESLNGDRSFVVSARNVSLGDVDGGGAGGYIFVDGESTGNIGINTTTPGARLEVNGQVKITGGVPGAGKVLTSDATGLATWTTPSGTTLITNPGTRNLFAGVSAGAVNSTGTDNTFMGFSAGSANTTPGQNTFIGSAAGIANITGGLSTIVGWRAGHLGTVIQGNTLIGAEAGRSSNASINTMVGEKAGQNTTTGGENIMVGSFTGNANITGTQLTLIGRSAEVGASNLTNATAIGSRARVDQSNSLVLGSVSGINGATNNTNVGIGTTTPATTLHVNGSLSLSTRVTSGAVTILATDYIVINNGAAATWTLPASPSTGRILIIVNQGTGAITTSAAYRTTNATTTTTIALSTSAQLVYDGTEWRKIN